MLIGLGHRPDLELGMSQPRVHAEVPVGTRSNTCLWVPGCAHGCSKPDRAHRETSLLLSSGLLWATQPGRNPPVWGITHQATTKERGVVSMPDSIWVIWGQELCRCTLLISEQEYFGSSKGYTGSATQPGQHLPVLPALKTITVCLECFSGILIFTQGFKNEAFW